MTPHCVIRYATPDDVPALRRLVQRANARLFCGPALVADIGGVLGAAVSLADGQVVADPSQPTSVLRRLLRTATVGLPPDTGGQAPGRERGV